MVLHPQRLSAFVCNADGHSPTSLLGAFFSRQIVRSAASAIAFGLLLWGITPLAQAQTLAQFQAGCPACHGAAPNGPNFNAAGSTAIISQANANGMGAAPDVPPLWSNIAAYIESVRPITTLNVPYRATGAAGSATSTTVDDIYVNSTYKGISNIATTTAPGKGSVNYTLPASGNPTANYTPAAGVCGSDSWQYHGTPTGTVGNTTNTTTRTANVTIANPVLDANDFSTSVAYSTSATTISLVGNLSGDGATSVTIISQPSVGSAAGSGGGANTITYTASSVAYASPVTIQYRTNACGQVSPIRTITLTVGAPPAPVFTSSSTATAGQTGVPYSFNVTATSSNTAATFSLVAGALPNGLSISAAGVISGTPTVVGGFSATIKAQNLNTTGTNQVVNFNITLGPPVYTAPVSASGAVGANYTAASPLYQITATNSPTSFGAPGGLPAGLSLNTSTGAITGTPTTAGSSAFTLTASNGVAPAASQSVSFNISNVAPVVTSPGPAPGQTGVSFSFQITATNAPSPTGYSASGLPPGLNVSSSGLISGTPTTVGNYTPTVSASNGTGTGSLLISMPITLGPPVVNSAATASGAVGIVFAGYQITATNSPTSFTSSGLPPGLTMSASGLISGTPTSSGTFSATVGALNGTLPNGSQAVTFNIAVGIPAITSGPTASLLTGQPFSYQISGTNGPTAFTATGLPSGLSMSASGLISGTTFLIGGFTIPLTATNGTGTGNGSLTLTTTLGPPVVTSPAIANIVVTQAFSYQITAQNAPTGFGALNLPAGLSVNTTTGLISGVPQATGSFTATISAANAVGSGTQSLVFTSANPPAPNVAARSVTVGFNTATPINLTSAISGQFSSIAVATAPANGSTSVSGNIVTFTPTTGYFGTDSFAYTATGLGGTSAPATVSITVSTQAPTAGAAAMTVQINTPTTLDLAPFIQGSAISGIVIAAAPVHGTAAVNGTQVIYTPNNNYFGVDAFTYSAFGNAGASPPAAIGVTVIGRPDPTKDAAVVGLLAAQAQTAQRFARAQIGNVQARLESLHRVGDSTDQRSGLASGSRVAAAAPVPLPNLAANIAAPADPFADRTAQINNAGGKVNALSGSTIPTAAFNQGANFAGGAGQANWSQAALSQPGSAQRTGSKAGFLNASVAMIGNAISDPARPGSSGVPYASEAISLLTTRSFNVAALAGSATTPDSGARLPDAYNFWIGGIANFGTHQAAGGTNGFDFTTNGISIGLDHRISNDLLLGIGAGFARDRTDIGTDGSNSRAHGYSAMLYASYQPSTNTFIDGLIGAGSLDFKTIRYVSAINDFAHGDRSGYQLFTSIAAGYEYRKDGMLISPYGRIDYSADSLNESSENGAGAYALTYFRATTPTLQGALGLRAETLNRTSFGWATPRVRIEYRHDFQGKQDASIAYADLAASGPRYTVSSAPVARNSLVFGVGADIIKRGGLNIGIDYQYEHSFSKNNDQAVRVLFSQDLDGRGSPFWENGINLVPSKPVDIQVDAGFTYDTNVTRAKDAADKLPDRAYGVNIGKGLIFSLGDRARAVLTGTLGAENFQTYSALNRASAGLLGELRFRNSAEFDSPTWALSIQGSGEDYRSKLRSGTRYAVSASVSQPFTDRITLFGAITHNQRYAKSTVFSNRNNSVRLNIDYAWSSSDTLYISGEYRRGQIISSGRPSLGNLAVADVLVQDDAFPNGEFFTYRFKGDTVLSTLGYNIGFGPRHSLDLSWRRAQSAPESQPSFATQRLNYIADQYSIIYLVRF